MLILTRKSGETIVIGNATIKVKRITGGTVVIAIDAPREVKIVRGELEQRSEAA